MENADAKRRHARSATSSTKHAAVFAFRDRTHSQVENRRFATQEIVIVASIASPNERNVDDVARALRFECALFLSVCVPVRYSFGRAARIQNLQTHNEFDAAKRTAVD